MNVLSVYTGQEVSVSAVVEDLDGNPVAPDTLTLIMKDPLGVETPITAWDSNPQVGLYIIRRTLSARGTHGFRIESINPDSTDQFNVTTDWSST
jgi:hypothetical protein